MDWLKTKCLKHEEFVIGGYTEPADSRRGFGALLVGYHDKEGELRYAGEVGTGFDQKTLNTLLQQLTPLKQKSSPFANLWRRVGPVRTAHWVKPTMVVQIAYGSRTRDGHKWHASYQRLHNPYGLLLRQELESIGRSDDS